MIEECRTRKYHERKRQKSSLQSCDPAYVTTSQEQPMIIPHIIITPSTVACENQPERQGDTEVRLPCTEMSESNIPKEILIRPLILKPIHSVGDKI